MSASHVWRPPSPRAAPRSTPSARPRGRAPAAARAAPRSPACSQTPRETSAMPREPGKVRLVGAGPGAADLLTVRALRAIEGAQALLYDALVADEVIAL